MLFRSTVAPPGFNRWLVPPAALAIHLCIGMAYGFSVFWKPLGQALVDAHGQPLAACGAGAVALDAKLGALARALVATDCNWSQFDLGWMYTLFFVVLGCSAALWGGWLERAGPRKAGVVAATCWCGGLLVSAVGVRTHQLTAFGRFEGAGRETVTKSWKPKSKSEHDGFLRRVERDGQLAKKKLIEADRKSTRLNSSHSQQSRMPSSA